jgi:hypothetical protein
MGWGLLQGTLFAAKLRSAARWPMKGIQALVVEAQPVDQRVGLGQAEHAWLGVAGLGPGCDGAHLHKAKAHGAQAVDAARVFVQPGGQAHAVGEAQPGQFDGVIDHAIAPAHCSGVPCSGRAHAW